MDERAPTVETASGAVVSFDERGRIIGFNRAAQRTFGYQRDEVLGRQALELLLAPAERRHVQALIDGFLAHRDEGELEGPLELEMRDAMGGNIPARVAVVATRSDGRWVFHAFVVDLSLRREAEVKAERLESLVEGSAEALIAADRSLVVTSVNKAAERLFGYEAIDIEGSPLSALFVEGDRQRLAELFGRVLAGESFEAVEATGRRRDRKLLPLSLEIAPSHDAAGKITGLSLAASDESARLQAASHAERLEAIVSSTDEAITTTDRQGTVIGWNEAAARLFGWPAEEIVGKPISTIYVDGERPDACELIDLVLREGTPERFETVRRHRDGTRVPVEVKARLLRDEDQGTLIATVERDITERKQFQSQLTYLSDHDPLTGLHNRRHFSQHLERELEHARKQASFGAVALIDLDHFKFVNDSFGQRVGDDLLRELGNEIAKLKPEGAEVAHLGIDEFALLLPRTPLDRAEDLVERILEAISDYTRRTLDLPMTASAALAPYDGSGPDSAEQLMADADMALFDAKDAGGGQLVVFSGDHAPRLKWADRLRAALADDRLCLYAQPILDLKTDRVASHELLLRMRDERDRIVEPSSLLAAAERLGMIGEIDRWVARRGIELAAAGHAVEINLSGPSVTDHELLAEIEAQLQNSGARPEDIVFEITETAAIASVTDASEFAAKLERLGCRFALDDFGTGFGSFVTLKHLPVAVLKIDGEFVRNLANSEVDRQIVKAIVSVAGLLGHKTVAEWVSDDETLQLVRELGVDYAQGWAVGRPEPADQLPVASAA